MAEQCNPTDRETTILKVLWELGEGSVRDVHERLAPRYGLHFNTIQTQLRIMEEKSLVDHRTEGRTFIYRPLCSREQISSHFLKRVYDGALNDLVLNMLQSEQPSEAELKELEHLIAQARKQAAKPRKKGK